MLLEGGFDSGINSSHLLLGSPPGGLVSHSPSSCAHVDLATISLKFHSARIDLSSDVKVDFQVKSQFMNIYKYTGNSTGQTEYRHIMIDFDICRPIPKTQPPG